MGKVELFITPLWWQRKLNTLQIKKTYSKIELINTSMHAQTVLGFFVGSKRKLSLKEKKIQYSRLPVSPEKPGNTVKRAFNHVHAWQRHRITSKPFYKHVRILLQKIIKNVIFFWNLHVYLPSQADVTQSGMYPLSVLFPVLLSSSFPVLDGMTDQGNRLSYILINPSPDTRLELHDVV